MEQSEKKKGFYKNLISGGISASIARTMTNPIERLEILRQVENVDYKGLSISRSFIKFYQTQGFSGLLKGNSASIARIFPFSAIEFYSMEYFKALFGNKTSIGYTMLCGSLSGLNSATLTFPLDVARTRLAINTQNSNVKEKKLFLTLINLYKDNGLKGLYKGYSLVVIGTVPFIAVKQTTFEYLKNNFMYKEYRDILFFIYGSISGIVGTLLLYPTYLIKRILQANNDKNFSLIKHCIDLLKRYGIRGYYLGLSMTLLKTGPYIGITFWCNEKLKRLLGYEK